jgi:hypothetical protein
VCGVDRLREIHRALYISEEHRHLLALAFERAAGSQDLLGMLRVVGARVRRRDRGGRLLSEAVAARIAEAILQ